MKNKQYSIGLTGGMPRFLTGERRRAYGHQKLISLGLSLIWVIVTVGLLGTAITDGQRQTRWRGLIALAIVLAVGKVLYQFIRGETRLQLARKERQQLVQSSKTNGQELADFAAQAQQKDYNDEE